MKAGRQPHCRVKKSRTGKDASAKEVKNVNEKGGGGLEENIKKIIDDERRLGRDEREIEREENNSRRLSAVSIFFPGYKKRGARNRCRARFSSRRDDYYFDPNHFSSSISEGTGELRGVRLCQTCPKK